MKYPKVACPKLWDTTHYQVARDGDKEVNVAALIAMSKELQPYNLPIHHIALPVDWLTSVSMLDFVGHMKMVLDADLDMAIIIDHDGHIADGRHRLAKALLEGRRTIKAVRLKTSPYR